MVSLLWSTVLVCLNMHHGVQKNVMHHMWPPVLLVAVVLFVLVAHRSLEQAMLTHADMHEPAAVLT
jgi:hypothetical protein